MGIVAAALLLYAWAAIVFHAIPMPKISGVEFLVLLFGSVALSVAAGLRGSRWWYLVTACFGGSLLLLWVAEFLFEHHG
jgi:hypothetical protein